jgi:hypothetical protein
MTTEIPTTCRTNRIASLLDKTIDNAAASLEDGTLSSSQLKEIVALAKTVGVEIAEVGQPISAASSRFYDSVLESLNHIDPVMLA